MKIFWTFVLVLGAASWFGFAFGFAFGLLPAPLWAQTLAFIIAGLSALADALMRWAEA